MKPLFKILFSLFTLSCITINSVTGIVQSEQLRITGFKNQSGVELSTDNQIKKTVLNENKIENELLCEDQSEDNKEESFAEVCEFNENPSLNFNNNKDQNGYYLFLNTVSFNILYCVFRI